MRFLNYKDAFIIEFTEEEIKTIEKNKKLVIIYPESRTLLEAISTALTNACYALKNFIDKNEPQS